MTVDKIIRKLAKERHTTPEIVRREMESRAAAREPEER